MDDIQPPTAPPREQAATRLASRDLYRLRRTHLVADHASLRAELARHRLRELVLELERRYGVLGVEATIDIHTGAVRPQQPAIARPKEQTHGPVGTTDQGTPRPAR